VPITFIPSTNQRTAASVGTRARDDLLE